MPRPRLEQIETLLRVVELGSFAAAAREAGLSPSAVSKQVGRLEADLGVRLLQRTTRSLSLTEEGRRVVERGRAVTADLEALAEEISGLTAEPRGRLRLSLPEDFGAQHLAAPLAAFAARHPALALEVQVSDRIVDLVEEGFDAAVRVGLRPDSSLVARRLAVCRLVACAAPDYLLRRGEPRHAAALRAHECIGYSLQSRWRLRERGRVRSFRPRTRLETNAGWLLREWARAGQGIALLPDFLVAGDLADGRLREVLAGRLVSRLDVAVVYPERRAVTPKLRRLIDFLVEHFAGWSAGRDQGSKDRKSA